ncbi:MAG TPA: heparan-alpha-glucosaminide N-acetyltransferase domain-containing protein [Dongiaceae bacterium]|nr:heparan-alpha-glucosaminide N-acetyltransferase domain-containing protein [Dongiaceae bacterium]
MKRLEYIDWMRGLACVLMFQTHCYDSWLSAEARKSPLFAWSQLGGTLPAPLFIFLSGVSFALVTEKLRERGAPRGAIARQTITRGAQVFGLGLVFRLQEYLLGYGYSTWTDLLRVDVLNILGISMMLMGLLCWVTAPRDSRDAGASLVRSLTAALATAAVLALVTPPLWTTLRPRFLPWPLESYINGVHIFSVPQPWLFPIFPWTAFAFAGLAVGFWLFGPQAKRLGDRVVAIIVVAAAGCAALALLFDGSRFRLYAVYDYWHTSPNFFLMRCAVLLAILAFAYAWCRWGLGCAGFSPLTQLGKTSLLVYWVHIELVYGRLSILPKGRCSIALATLGLLTIFLAMLGISLLRTRWKQRRREATARGTAVPAES